MWSNAATDEELFAAIAFLLEDASAVDGDGQGDALPPTIDTYPFESHLAEQPACLLHNSPLPPASATATETTPGIGKKRRRPRNVEIRELRHQVAYLETLRDSLTHASKAATTIPPDSTTASGDSSAAGINTFGINTGTPTRVASLADTIGYGVARRQRERRDRALAENFQLRNQIQDNTLLLSRLQTRVKQQQGHLGGLAGSMETAPYKSPLLNEMAVYMKLTARIPGLYKQTDIVFAGQLDTAPKMTSLDLQGSTVLLDSIDTRLVPFSLDRTVHAVWNWVCSGSIEYKFSVTERQSLDLHTVQKQFSGEFGIAQTRARWHGNILFRRFEEVDRVVIVSTAAVDPERQARPHQGTGQILPGVDHSQWIVISKSKTTRSCTEIICRDVSRCGGDIDDITSSGFSGLQHLVATGLAERQEHMREFVDNTLLDLDRSCE